VNVNTIVSHKGVFWLLSFSALAVLGNSSSAVAQTVNSTSSFQLTQASETEASSSNVSAEVETATSSVSSQTPIKSNLPLVKPAPESQNLIASEQQSPVKPQPETAQSNLIQSEPQSLLKTQPETAQSNLNQQKLQFSTNTQYQKANRVVTPVPGTTATSSAAFSVPSTNSTSQASASSITQTDKSSVQRVAQADITVTPGRVTRGGASYIGIAGNIGLTGNSALGDGNFTLISKIGLTRTVSARPAAVLGSDPVILLPLTYDFNIRSSEAFTEPLPIAPYLGGGAAIRTGDNSDVAFLVTGGIDVPLTRQFTATAAINAAFFGDTDVGLLIGVGYNFRGF
jgi:hypothetical protein